ncbi:MAG: hypothetical protein GQ569_00835 [Methylococcaceae bacterium]|nr:hypothetical protein [Methylococcaceae bacterium]
MKIGIRVCLTIATLILTNCSTSSLKILKTYDGDTMTLLQGSDKIKVRYYCIDTPEMKQGDWGKRSRDYLRKLAPNDSVVTLEIKDTDRYGRKVSIVNLNGKNLNLEMVKAGMAAVYPQYCKDSDYFEAQDYAKRKRLGIWKTNGLHQRPWVYRKSKRK